MAPGTPAHACSPLVYPWVTACMKSFWPVAAAFATRAIHGSTWAASAVQAYHSNNRASDLAPKPKLLLPKWEMLILEPVLKHYNLNHDTKTCIRALSIHFEQAQNERPTQCPKPGRSGTSRPLQAALNDGYQNCNTC